MSELVGGGRINGKNIYYCILFVVRLLLSIITIVTARALFLFVLT